MDGDSRERLVGLAADQLTIGFAVADPAGSLVEVNGALCRILGRSREDLLGHSFQDVTASAHHETDRGLAREIAAAIIDSFHRRTQIPLPDGSVLHADITVTGVREDGTLVGFAGVVVDVTEEVQAQERLRALIDTMQDPWVLMEALRDPDGRIVDFVYRDANSAACAYNGVAHEDLVGLTLLELLPAHLDSGLLAQYAEVVETGVPLVLDDSPFPSDEGEGVRYFDNRGVKAGDGISFTWRDVTDRVERRKALAAQARQDPLTGLANRTGLLEGIEEAFQREPRQGEHVAVLYCDVDGLKAVNDGFGHRVGDHLLRSVADRMTGSVRRDDIVARIGGDEFVVVAVGVTDDQAALSLAAKLAEAVSRPLTVDGANLLPRISIGVAMARPGQNPEDVLAAADRALYRQKKPAEVITLPLPRTATPEDPEDPDDA